MQCVAWAGMVVSYSQESTVAEAVEKTFDGEHPCPLCLAIREAEKEGNPALPERVPAGREPVKLCKDMLPPELIRTWPELSCGEREPVPPGADATGLRRNTPPPFPPPRRTARPPRTITVQMGSLFVSASDGPHSGSSGSLDSALRRSCAWLGLSALDSSSSAYSPSLRLPVEPGCPGAILSCVNKCSARS